MISRLRRQFELRATCSGSLSLSWKPEVLSDRSQPRTKNQELPKTPALQTAGFFIIPSIPLRLGVIPYQASESILLEFNIHYSLFNILRRSRNAAHSLFHRRRPHFSFAKSSFPPFLIF